MDSLRQFEKKPIYKKYWYLILIAVLLLCYFVASSSLKSATYVADSNAVLVDEVKRGEFLVLVRGPGVLVPKNVNLVTSYVDGKVDSLEVKPGTHVRKGDVLATLSNIILEQQLEEQKLELEAQIAENLAKEISIESQLLDLKAELLNTELNYQSAKSKYEAEGKLINQGVLTVSRLDYENSLMLVTKHKQAIQTNKQRFENMQRNLNAHRSAHTARIKKLKNKLQQMQSQVDALIVTATVDGVVQEMELELGQQVLIGSNIAKLARKDNLIAEVDIQEIQVKNIVIGQLVTIDTRSSKVAGVVSRIDPVVNNGIVKVDVEITESLPSEARPDLSVEGVIEIARKQDSLYVKRPVFARSFDKVAVYKLDDEGDFAELKLVELGQASTNYIEVLNGLVTGDKIIISDPTAWEQHDRIKIK